jgi:hypothetical protein
MANLYTAGQIVEFPILFLDDTGTPYNPAAVSFLYSINNGATNTLTYSGATTPAVNVVARLATGSYQARLNTTGYATTATIPVVYEWNWDGEKESSSFNVQPAPL